MAQTERCAVTLRRGDAVGLLHEVRQGCACPGGVGSDAELLHCLSNGFADFEEGVQTGEDKSAAVEGSDWLPQRQGGGE